MARGHVDLPKKTLPVSLSKKEIFAAATRIDKSSTARARVLSMETDFRKKIATHLSSLPAAESKLRKFNTSPFVLMFYARQQNYQYVSQIEKDIIPAKVFSSMETSAGRMIEEVVLPAYGWKTVPSEMHSIESVLDGRKKAGTRFLGVTLKSGPRCLNDEMAKDIGTDVAKHVVTWAKSHKADGVDFTYGVLYGTKKQSNKKDWHILRNIAEVLPRASKLHKSHKNDWSIHYAAAGIDVIATIRVGLEWWNYLGGKDAWLEVCMALIRACIDPVASTHLREESPPYRISDLPDILDMSSRPVGFNIALLQQSQLEWLLFLANHFCDELTA